MLTLGRRHRTIGELTQQLVLRHHITPRPEKCRKFKHRLRLLRIALDACAQNFLHHRIQRPRLGKGEHLLLHIGRTLRLQQLDQPLRRTVRISAAQISFTAQQHNRGKIAAIALEPFIQQLRRFNGPFVIQQCPHQLPAIVLYLRHHSYQFTQPVQTLIQIDREFKIMTGIEQCLLRWWCGLRRRHQRFLQVLQRSKPLMQAHATAEEIEITPVAEMQQRQAVFERLVRLGKLVSMLVDARQIVQRVQFALRILLIGQCGEETRGALRKSSLQQQLRHLPCQFDVLRL